MTDTFNPGDGWREVTYGADLEGHESIVWESTGRAGGTSRLWVREEPVPPLPSEPGFYLGHRRGLGPAVVERLATPGLGGQWVDAGDRAYLDKREVRDMLPLVRLEPRAVTAKAILDAVEERGYSGAWHTTLITVAREFGVES